MLTALCVVAARKAEINQRVQIRVGHRKHMAATATVATVGAAELFVFFMAERDAAGSTVSGRDINIGFVNEFHSILPGAGQGSGEYRLPAPHGQLRRVSETKNPAPRAGSWVGVAWQAIKLR